MRSTIRRFVCWLLGHHPVGPPFYSPMCARCGLILHDNCTAWGDDSKWDEFVQAQEDQAENSQPHPVSRATRREDQPAHQDNG